MQPPLSRGSHSLSFLGKLASLGSSENWQITFWGNRGFSPYPVLDSTCQKQLCIRLSWPDSSSAVAVHTLFTAAPPPPLFPPVPLCLDILAGAGQTTVLQHLLCPLCSSSSCAWHGVGELTLGARKGCCTPDCPQAQRATSVPGELWSHQHAGERGPCTQHVGLQSSYFIISK